MFCRNCGAQIPDGAKFCPNCGTKVWTPPQETTPIEPVSEPKPAAESAQVSQAEPITTPQPEPEPQAANPAPQPEPAPQTTNPAPQPEPAPEAANPAPQPEPTPQPAYTAPQPEPEPQAAYTAPQPEPAPQPAYTAPQPEPEASGQNDGIGMIIKVIAIIGAVLYAYWAIRAVMTTFGYVGELLTLSHKISTLIYLIGSLLNLASCLIMALALILLAWRRTKENTEYMFMTVGAAGVIRIAAIFLRMVLSYIVRIARHYPMTSTAFTTFFRAAIYAVIIVGVLFAVLYASGNRVLIGRSGDELMAMLKSLPNFLSDEMDAITAQQTAAEVAAAQAEGTTAVEYQPAPRRMKTNRSFIVILLLGIITCGIYTYYVYYTIARDLNTMCQGDGKKTMGIIPHVLLDIVTCGIFEYFWQYSAAERMADNGPRFNANIHEGGSTILLWMIIGTFVCCLGSYFAMYFQIKNLNTLSAAYNRAVFGDQ